jgi:hypothetical protein
MEVEQNIVDYLEEGAYYDAQIAAGAYLDRVHLTNPATGFLKKGKTFKHVKWDIDGNTDLIIFNNIEQDYRYGHEKEYPHFQLVYRFQKGIVWSEVYKRKH